MRILLYTSTSRARLGGVQAVYRTLADGLRRRGHEVVEGWGSQGDGNGFKELVAPLHRPHTWNLFPSPVSAARVVRDAWNLAGHLRRLKPDVVHINFVRLDSLYFIILHSLYGYKVVVTFHGSDIYNPEQKSKQYIPMISRRANAVTGISKAVVDKLRRYVTEDRIALVPNGIDIDFWTAVSSQPSVLPTVVAVGRLESVKGFDVLAEAMSIVREKIGEVSLRIIGDGGERSSLSSLIKQSGFDPSEVLLGWLPREGIREVLRTASLLAVPSRSEGLSLAALEGMAVGLPVVASRVGGLPDIVTPWNGILVEPDSVEDLATAIAFLLSDIARATQLGSEGVKTARSFSDHAMVSAYEDVYKKVTKIQ